MNEIGNLLKNKREEMGISLEEAANDLELKVNILDNIEDGNMGCFKDIYALKDYLKNYAKYLGINPDKVEKDFNEYLFEYTSKIPVKEIEEKMIEKTKLEETTEIKIASPYTDKKIKYKSRNYIILYIIVIILVSLAIFWAIKQITVDNKIATMFSSVK